MPEDKKLQDEDKMIAKLEEHRDLKTMVIEIAKSKNIKVEPTYDNDKNGDFVYNAEDKKRLEAALDEYLLPYKHDKE